MYSKLNMKLEMAHKGVLRLHKIISMIKLLESEEKELKSKLSGLKNILDKENKDVEYILKKLGESGEQIDKERSEALAAKLKYDQALKDLEDIKIRINELENEKLKYTDSQSDYDFLIARKKEILMHNTGDAVKKQLRFREEYNHLYAELKETEEAITAGVKVLESLNRILNFFNCSLKGITSEVIEEVRTETSKIQKLFREFRTELADIQMSTSINLELNAFTNFSDLLYDELIYSCYLKAKIDKAKASVENVKGKVNIVMRLLYVKTEQINAKIAETEISQK